MDDVKVELTPPQMSALGNVVTSLDETEAAILQLALARLKGNPKCTDPFEGATSSSQGTETSRMNVKMSVTEEK